MKKIIVKTSNYPIYYGKNVFLSFGKIFSSLFFGKKIILVTDSVVYDLYGKTIENALNNYTVIPYIVPPKEQAKTFDEYRKLLLFALENNLNKDDCLIALGGGSITDLVGFCASTYKRRINYFNIPTTLLSGIDASLGGKTGINTEFGKNAIGSFYDPKAVFFDISTIDTLPENEIVSGMGELVKYAVLTGDDKLFDLFLHGKKVNETHVKSAICYKSNIVSGDQFDNSSRRLLNLGHTVGHIIEKQSGYTISHGLAVAYGIKVMATLSYKRQLLNENEFEKINSALNYFDFSYIKSIHLNDIIQDIIQDKKTDGNGINIVLIKGIGQVITASFEENDFLKFIR